MTAEWRYSFRRQLDEIRSVPDRPRAAPGHDRSHGHRGGCLRRLVPGHSAWDATRFALAVLHLSHRLSMGHGCLDRSAVDRNQPAVERAAAGSPEAMGIRSQLDTQRGVTGSCGVAAPGALQASGDARGRSSPDLGYRTDGATHAAGAPRLDVRGHYRRLL